MQNCKSAPLEMGTAVARSVLRQAAVVECSPCLGLGAWGFLPLGAGSLMVLVVLGNLQIGLCEPSFVSHHIPCSILHPVPSSILCHPASHAMLHHILHPMPPCILFHPASHPILHPMPPSIPCHPPSHPPSCTILHAMPSFIPCHPPSCTASPVPSTPHHPSPRPGAVAGNHGVAGRSAVPCPPGADGNELTEHRQH